MSEIYKIILTSALTVLGGITILTIGQIIQKFIIEPIQEFAKLRGEISETLIFYANANANMTDYYLKGMEESEKRPEPEREIVRDRYKNIISAHWKRQDDASTKLRQLSSQLLAKATAIPLYPLFSFLLRFPRKADISAAASGLIRLSNSMRKEEHNTEKIIEIGRQLKLKFLLAHYGK